MVQVLYKETWAVIKGCPIEDTEYWANKGLIPLGSLKPFEEYDWDSMTEK